jgi:hypothetical protein
MSVVMQVFGCRPHREPIHGHRGRHPKTFRDRIRGMWGAAVRHVLWRFRCEPRARPRPILDVSSSPESVRVEVEVGRFGR